MGRPSRYQLKQKHYQEEAKNFRDYVSILGYTKATVQTKYLNLKTFFYWLESIGIYRIEYITALEITNYYEHLEHRKNIKTGKVITSKTVYDNMRTIEQYFGYLQSIDKIEMNPSSHIRVSCLSETVERRIFSQEEIQAMYKVTKTDQESILLHMGYGCGLRVQEISDLNREDVRLTEQLIIVKKGKNSKRRVVPITDKVSEEISSFLFSNEKEIINQNGVPLLMNNRGRRMQSGTMNKLLKDIIRRTDFGRQMNIAELNTIGIHSLRHSIATHFIERGMELEQVRQFLGHSCIESTEIYTHISQAQLKQMK